MAPDRVVVDEGFGTRKELLEPDAVMLGAFGTPWGAVRVEVGDKVLPGGGGRGSVRVRREVAQPVRGKGGDQQRGGRRGRRNDTFAIREGLRQAEIDKLYQSLKITLMLATIRWARGSFMWFMKR